MSKEINMVDASLNIFLEINGEVHMVAMTREKLDAIKFLVGNSVSNVIPTGKSQAQLNVFLGYEEVTK